MKILITGFLAVFGLASAASANRLIPSRPTPGGRAGLCFSPSFGRWMNVQEFFRQSRRSAHTTHRCVIARAENPSSQRIYDEEGQRVNLIRGGFGRCAQFTCAQAPTFYFKDRAAF